MKSSSESHIDRARDLRESQSPPEGVLWSYLRSRRLAGHKFRRQMPLAEFVVDFCCPESKLVVEMDSIYHRERRADDHARDARLASLGYRVLRVTASDLAKDRDAVLRTILRYAVDGAEEKKQRGE